VLDDGSRPVCDRAWAYWTDRRWPVSGAAGHPYRQLAVHTLGRSRVMSLSRYRYEVITGAALLQLTRSLAATMPGLVLRDGHAGGLEQRRDVVRVMADGRPVDAAWVFDSVAVASERNDRPQPPPKLWMTFTGRVVRTQRPVFDPTIATLFDFRTAQRGDARFVHLLPRNPQEALVQLTGYSASPRTPLVDDLIGYVDHVLHCPDAAILPAESGRLPLRPVRLRRDGGAIVAIGANAGLLKASTGYAFERIQRHTDALVEKLTRSALPPAREGSAVVAGSDARHRWLDEVFLRAVATDPAVLEQAFDALVAGHQADRLLAFLDEQESVAQDMGIVAALPKAPFVRAAATVAATALSSRWRVRRGLTGSAGTHSLR